MFNLNDALHFVRVVDHGGFTAAARRTGIAKSTLAKRVAALEAELGVRLIQRSSRRFSVTDAGKDFHRHAAAMLIEAETAEDLVRGRMAEPSGMVRITASIPTAQNALAGPLVELALAYPKLQVAIEATDRFVDLLQEGFDIAVRDHFGPLPDSGLLQRTIGSDPFFLVAAPAYLAAHGHPQAPADLATHRALASGLQAGSWRLEHVDGSTAEARPAAAFHANEASLLLAAAVGGLGIACLPRKLCLAALQAGTVARVLPDWTAGRVTTTLLMPHRRGQLPSVRLVADALARHARESEAFL